VRILIDTHAFLWAILQPDRMSAGMRRRYRNPDNMILLSAASIWEIGAKYALGKLPLIMPPHLCMPRYLASQRITILSLTLEHALHAHQLPPHHRDPFDCMILAQATAEQIPIMTADNAFGLYDVRLFH
jgi:PIN domain nuclease of toxin-antitoxin system